jgi:hypothetical protein
MARALEPSVRLTLLAVLSDAAAEITAQLGDTFVEVRLAGGQPSFVTQQAAPAPAGTPAPGAGSEEPDDAGVARITLRLSEGLKSRIEASASAEGVSVNAWLARAARQALESPHSRATSTIRLGLGQRITGFARS